MPPNISPKLFRSLMILAILLSWIAAFVDSAFPSLIPSAVSQAQEALPELPKSKYLLMFAVLIPIFLMGLISTFGLFFFKSWARSFSLCYAVLSLAIYPLAGFYISSGWAIAISELSTTLWGAVLAIAYFSPLSERFTKQQGNTSSAAVQV